MRLPPGCRLDASSDRSKRRVMSRADELLNLDALRKSGLLTRKEFKREKARVLGGTFPSGGPPASWVPLGAPSKKSRRLYKRWWFWAAAKG
jgi:hypothetical protein